MVGISRRSGAVEMGKWWKGPDGVACPVVYGWNGWNVFMIISTEEIFLAGSRLRDSRVLACDVNAALREAAASPEYQAWCAGLAQTSPYAGLDREVELVLTRVGLAERNALRVRVNGHSGKMFATDGVWVDPQYRVFPYSDESHALLWVANAIGWSGPVDYLIDLATGCGHTAIAWAYARNRIGYDINPRALAFAEFNRLLNEAGTGCRWGLNNIEDGIPAMPSGSIVVVANMPFGPAPTSSSLPLTSNGGADGLRLQRATFEGLDRLAQHLGSKGSHMRAMVMGFSPGDAARGRWDLEVLAREMLPGCKVSWVFCEDKVMRVDGVRRFSNPCSIEEALGGLGGCRVYTPDATQRSAKIEQFRGLAKQHKAAGKPDLAYGVTCLEWN